MRRRLVNMAPLNKHRETTGFLRISLAVIVLTLPYTAAIPRAICNVTATSTYDARNECVEAKNPNPIFKVAVAGTFITAPPPTSTMAAAAKIESIKSMAVIEQNMFRSANMVELEAFWNNLCLIKDVQFANRSESNDLPTDSRAIWPNRPSARLEKTCYSRGERCLGASGHPFVPYLPCCNGETCTAEIEGQWGRNCEGICYQGGERCMGAPGMPFVQHLPCCSGATCKASSTTWGKFCEIDQTCYAVGERCMGAPGYPAVPQLGCCNKAVCTPNVTKGWGSWCTLVTPQAPPASPQACSQASRTDTAQVRATWNMLAAAMENANALQRCAQSFSVARQQWLTCCLLSDLAIGDYQFCASSHLIPGVTLPCRAPKPAFDFGVQKVASGGHLYEEHDSEVDNTCGSRMYASRQFVPAMATGQKSKSFSTQPVPVYKVALESGPTQEVKSLCSPTKLSYTCYAFCCDGVYASVCFGANPTSVFVAAN
jgi:hypothetical protein